MLHIYLFNFSIKLCVGWMGAMFDVAETAIPHPHTHIFLIESLFVLLVWCCDLNNKLYIITGWRINLTAEASSAIYTFHTSVTVYSVVCYRMHIIRTCFVFVCVCVCECWRKRIYICCKYTITIIHTWWSTLNLK